jgi:hypothetical protein
MGMNEAQIAQIVEKVVSNLHKEQGIKAPAFHSASSRALSSQLGGRGVHATVDEAVKAV